MNTSAKKFRQGRATVGLFMSLMFLLFATAAFAQPAIVSFDPAQGPIVCGQTGTIEVVIDDSIEDLRGFSLELVFDPNLITPVSVEAGSLMADAGCSFTLFWLNPTGSGSIQVDGAMLGCSIQGPGAILSIEFLAVENDEGQTSLACQSVILRDGDNMTIPAECQQATVEVTCPVNTFQSSWGMVKALYR